MYHCFEAIAKFGVERFVYEIVEIVGVIVTELVTDLRAYGGLWSKLRCRRSGRSPTVDPGRCCSRAQSRRPV